jgi:hypothetical protein
VPGAAGLEQRQQRLGDPERAEHVDVVHPLPVVDRAGRHRVGAARAAGVVDQQGERAVEAGHRVRQVGDRVVVGDVALDRGGVADLLDQGLEPVGAPGGRDHVETLPASRRAVAAPIPLDAPSPQRCSPCPHLSR